MADALARSRTALEQDPALNLGEAEMAKVEAVIDHFAGPYLAYLQQGSAATKDKSALNKSLSRGIDWIRYFWPLGTTSVSYADRIYVYHQSSHATLQATMEGQVAGSAAVTWFNPDTAAGELDIAALVNDVHGDRLDILLFNFSDQSRDIGLTLQGLAPGSYQVRIGRDANHDDFLDGTPHTQFVLGVKTRGQDLVLGDVRAGLLQKIEIRQLSAADPSGSTLLPDPAISADDVVLQPGGAVQVTVHNVGSAAASGVSLELYQNGVMLASGSVPAIEAPLDLTARSVTVSLSCTPSDAPLTVVLQSTAEEVTQVNNQVIVTPKPQPKLTLTSSGTPGVFTLNVDAPGAAGQSYWVAASWTGTEPGMQLGELTLPIVYDGITWLSLAPSESDGIFSGTVGVLDAAGKGLARVNIPQIASAQGKTFYFAVVTFQKNQVVKGVSQPLSVKMP